MRGIVFDLDDTLYPREHFVFSGFAAVARHVEREWRVPATDAFATLCQAMFTGSRGNELQLLCERHDRAADAADGLLHVYRNHVPELTLPESSRTTLQQLRRDGWRIGILTNGHPDIQARKVAALGLRPLVTDVVYAADHAAGGKPACAAFDAVLMRLGVLPGDAVCVGDDLRCDIYGARAAGLRTIRLKLRAGLPAIADDADAVVESIEDVPALAGLMVSGRPDRLRNGERVLSEVANVA